MPLSRRLRFEVFRRDLFTCRYCGQRPPDVVLECDHVIPVSRGGVDDIDNLCTSCFDCNRGKTNVELESPIPEIGELARLAAIQEMNERAQLLVDQQRATAYYQDAMDSLIDTVTTWWTESGGDPSHVARRTIVVFLTRGLTLARIRDAIDATSGRWGRSYRAWTYFCGVCWTMIRRLEGSTGATPPQR